MITLEVPVERTTTEQHGINEQVLVLCLSVDRSFNRRELKRPMQSLISEAARNIVTNLLEPINREDFATARTFLQNDMRYFGVFGLRHHDAIKWFEVIPGEQLCIRVHGTQVNQLRGERKRDKYRTRKAPTEQRYE